jgi:formylglycine-generating enzyme required for sulfatase activity
MVYDVFISYPHQDKAVADAACAKLETEGVRCWIAPRDVPPGAEWASAIVDAIDNCRVMILIFSEHTNRSKQVHREVQRAFDGEKPVVPFRIENVNPEKTLRYYMGSVHWLDALTPPVEQHLEKLLASVEALLKAPTRESQIGLGADGEGRPGGPDKSEAPIRHSLEGARAIESDTRRDLRRLQEQVRSQRPVRAVIISISSLVLFGAALVAGFGAWQRGSGRPIPTVASSAQAPLPHSAVTPSVPPPLPKVAAAPTQPAPPAADATKAMPLVEPPPIKVFSLSPEKERALKPKDILKECDKCPEMVVVPLGSFTMGSPTSEKGREKNEGPQHKVTFAKPFAVGKFAVTFEEWDACVSDGGCDGKPNDNEWGRGLRPVINVSWEDAKAYVKWLSKRTGRPYRLLSESEREYVTRAGTTKAFWWGNEISTSQANYDGNAYGNGGEGENRERTVAVDSFEPNPWGLYQVHGNVMEWTEDCYHDNYIRAPVDGSPWTAGDCNDGHVARGGSWRDDPGALRSAARGDHATLPDTEDETGDEPPRHAVRRSRRGPDVVLSIPLQINIEGLIRSALRHGRSCNCVGFRVARTLNQ